MSLDIEDVLEKRLKLVNEWLLFAEKKNAALLVFNAGTLWGVARLLKDSTSENYTILLNMGMAAVLVSLICCLISFTPVVNIGVLSKKTDTRESDNSLFFGHIAKYSSEEYIQFFQSCYQVDTPFLKYQKDYVEQLIINSRITSRKFATFNFALYLTIPGFIWLVIFCFLNEVF